MRVLWGPVFLFSKEKNAILGTGYSIKYSLFFFRELRAGWFGLKKDFSEEFSDFFKLFN